ncbi:MAG TPA: ribonuclease T2 [Rhodoblastus sp.]|nr:ribonuclease T2 [Rhodoblastus sp.]
MIRRLLAAVLLLLAAAPVAVAEGCILDNCVDRQPVNQSATRPQTRRGGPSGDFDFYVLALSWSPSFCAVNGDRAPAQCATGANPGFVVHGLWPQYDNGFPSRCPGNPFLPFSVLSSLGDLYPDQGLARHEWRQHGLCSGKSPTGYFADVRAARAVVAIPAAFKAPGAERSLSPLDIQRAFFEANPRLRPGMMALTCRRGMFQEARFCLSKDLRDFVACPQVARQSCRGQNVTMPVAQ